MNRNITLALKTLDPDSGGPVSAGVPPVARWTGLSLVEVKGLEPSASTLRKCGSQFLDQVHSDAPLLVAAFRFPQVPSRSLSSLSIRSRKARLRGLVQAPARRSNLKTASSSQGQWGHWLARVVEDKDGLRRTDESRALQAHQHHVA